jgi:hypothetical protein
MPTTDTAKTPRKAAPAKAEGRPAVVEPSEPSAAEAAAAETTDDDIKLTFRGFDYVIPRTRTRSMQFRMAIAANDLVSLVYELLQDDDARRFLLTVDRGEEPFTVAAEFVQAFGAAAGTGNSSASD